MLDLLTDLRCRVALALALGASFVPLATPRARADAREVLRARIEREAPRLEPRTVAWRRDFHAHPELGNQEKRTARIVAAHLTKLGLTVRTGVARTGVVAVLRGALPGPVVGLRADMDALPVKEATGLPFASRDKGRTLDGDVDVMHACGHDGHLAILMTVAELLAGMRDALPGTVVFYFSPAEEGPSDFLPDERSTWGVKMMIEEGVLKAPRPSAVFGLHLWAGIPAGRIAVREGPAMASSDDLYVDVVGKQTHAGRPWAGVDALVTAAQVVVGLQTVVSRQTDISASPTVVSLGTIHGGTRYNIIAELVNMAGTIRAYDPAIRLATHDRVRRTAEGIAAASGAQAKVRIVQKYDATRNDPALTARSLPSLRWAAHDDVVEAPLVSGAEDFSFFGKEVPSVFFFLGASAPGGDVAQAAPNHSPRFTLDESTLRIGVRALAALATDHLTAGR